MARKSLDDILDDNNVPELEATEAEAEAPPAEEATEPEPQPRDDSGKFAAKGVEPEPEPEQGEEPEVEPPSTDKLPKDVYEPLKAVRSENQSLKEQLDALRKEIQNQQPKEPPQPAPDMFGEPEQWQQHYGGQLVSTAVQQAAYQSRLQMSEMLMAEQNEDFADIKPQLVEFVGNNPTINQAVAESQHPWRTAYQAFKSQQTMQELGATDLNTLESKLREKILAELQEQAVPQAKVPPSLSTKRSVGSRTGPAWTGPKPLEDILD